MKNVMTTLAVTGLSISLFAACSDQRPVSYASVDPQYRVTPNNFEAADANNDGALNFKEYLALETTQQAEASLAMGKGKTVKTNPDTMKAALQSRFDLLDTNHNGKLGSAELGAD